MHDYELHVTIMHDYELIFIFLKENILYTSTQENQLNEMV